jgi:glycosyltransferase involved in cell wall biosynthesis
MAISAVLPAFNEAANLPTVVPRVAAALRDCTPDHEILVIDDGSSDGTPAVLEGLHAEVPALRVVRHPDNRGYGAALRSGFQAARCPWIFLMDADNQFDPAELSLLVAASRSADIVAGYRRQRSDPWLRQANAWAFFGLARLLCGPLVRDVNCAFKLMRTDLVASLGLAADGAVINAECLAKARRKGARIVEVAVHHYPRRHGKQTGANPRVVARAFRELIRLRAEIAAVR